MSSKFRRDPRDMDEDEECWFQNDDDVDDVVDDDPTMDGCFNTIGRLEDTFDSEEMTPSKKERKSTLGKKAFTEIHFIANHDHHPQVRILH